MILFCILESDIDDRWFDDIREIIENNTMFINNQWIVKGISPFGNNIPQFRW